MRSPRVYTREVLLPAVLASKSWSDVCRYLGKPVNGGTPGLIKLRTLQFGIPTNHFTGHRWSKGRTIETRQKRPEEILVVKSILGSVHASRLKRALRQLDVPHECSICGLGPTWKGKPLTLQVDHINGDRRDNRQANLRIVCPNCHTQTVTWGHQTQKVVKPKAMKRTAIVAKSKASWPSNEQLQSEIWATPALTVARRLGVSSTALKRYCKRRGIPTPPRGYWAKMTSNGR